MTPFDDGVVFETIEAENLSVLIQGENMFTDKLIY